MTMASKITAKLPFCFYEPMNDNATPSNEQEMETSSTDSGSEPSSPQKINTGPRPQISPEKVPLKLKLHDPRKQYRQDTRNPNIANLARRSAWLQEVMGRCGDSAKDTLEKAIEARKKKDHDKADQYDERTNQYMFQHISAAESLSKVQSAISQGLAVVPTKI